jgi:ubiquinone/menaquinone biosynthesis C-methylase UbiE
LQLKLPEKANQVNAYSSMAPIYDYLMRHVDYERWFRYVDNLLVSFAHNPEAILEIACGTGVFLEKFAGRNCRLLGMDMSFDMLKVARQRLSGLREDFLLWNGDMRAFALHAKVDVAICLYDSINYCLTENDFQRTLHCVHRNLQWNGVFIFDVCTRSTCKNYFRKYYEKDVCNGIDYVRKGSYNDKNKWQINEFWVAARQGMSDTFFERHVQKIYRLNSIKEMILQKNKWKILGIYHNFTRRPGTEKSYRVHFVLRKN